MGVLMDGTNEREWLKILMHLIKDACQQGNESRYQAMWTILPSDLPGLTQSEIRAAIKPLRWYRIGELG